MSDDLLRLRIFGWALVILGIAILAIALPRLAEGSSISLCNLPCTQPAFVHYADNVLKIYCGTQRTSAWLTIPQCASPKVAQPSPGNYTLTCS